MTSAITPRRVTVVAVGGGFSYGPLGMSHFATEDLAVMRAMPGMTVVAPSDPWQAYALTRQLHDQWRAFLSAHRQELRGPSPGKLSSVKFGRCETGPTPSSSRSAAFYRRRLPLRERLTAEGIDLRIIDVHTIKPLDSEAILGAALDCGRVFTLEEACDYRRPR